MSAPEEPESAAAAELAKRERIRAIDERIDRSLEEARRSLIEAGVYLNELRARGFLPPEEPRRRF